MTAREAAERLPQQRGLVHISDDLAAALIADRARVAGEAAELQRLLDLRHLTRKGHVVDTELGPAVLVRTVEQVLGGAS